MPTNEAPAGLYTLKAGDRVQVFSVNATREGQPPTGWDGEVTRVGRELITVKARGGRARQYRLEDGRWNNKDFGYQHYIKTVEQATEDARRHDLTEILRQGGVALRSGREFSMAVLEALVSALKVDTPISDG